MNWDSPDCLLIGGMDAVEISRIHSEGGSKYSSPNTVRGSVPYSTCIETCSSESAGQKIDEFKGDEVKEVLLPPSINRM